MSHGETDEAAWWAMTADQRAGFLKWTADEIERIRGGGPVADCFGGDAAAAIATLEAERDGYLAIERRGGRPAS